MKIESIEGWDKRARGTCLKGYITGDYDLLVETFGRPVADTDGYKSDAEWILILNDKIVVTIYNYKSGKNYLGEEGREIEDIKRWHVGGKSLEGLLLLDDYFEDNNIRLTTTLDRW